MQWADLPPTTNNLELLHLSRQELRIYDVSVGPRLEPHLEPHLERQHNPKLQQEWLQTRRDYHISLNDVS